MGARRPISAYWLGRVAYDRAHELQEKILRARIAQEVGDVLLLLEHEPVITLGRGADVAHVLLDEEQRRARGIALHETGRGGDATYHGPGQLVAYPIFDLRPDRCDVRRYVRDLAHVMIALAGTYGVGAGLMPPDPKYVGVWVDKDDPSRWAPLDDGDAVFPHRNVAKIGAIGVRLSRWCTMHGFAFNVSTRLEDFDTIVPCGIKEYGVASLESLGVKVPTVEAAAHASLAHFAARFDAEVDLLPASKILGDAPLTASR
jgi:lipoyl(octanoyl) transferase